MTSHWDLTTIKTKLRAHDDQFKLIRSDIKDVQKDVKQLHKEFGGLDKKLGKWKSQLFNKIDGFIGRIDSQDKEIAATNFRLEEHEQQHVTIST